MNNLRSFISPNYNFIFDRKTGFFARWGRTLDVDPEYSPFGPEIMDIEISTVCSRACSWCYKSNTANDKYMTFETFRVLFDKFPKNLNQVAFGIGDIDGNPDLWKIMHYCRDNKVVPNITINGQKMNDFYYNKLVELCGAVAVSHYDNETCFNVVTELAKRGLKQVNIHALLAEETFDRCVQVVKDSKSDERLKGLNAIVFLWLKPKGIRNQLTQITSLEKYKKLIDFAFKVNAKIGFDSCSAPSFLEAVKDRPDFKRLETMVEPCESTLFSYYISVDGVGYPCSFIEGQPGYKGINILEIKNFLKDVWYNEETKKFRDTLINQKNCMNCRVCPEFDLEVE